MSHPKKKSEKNKKQMDSKVKKTKEVIPGMNNHSKKEFAKVLHSKKEIVNSIKQKLDQQEIEDFFVDTLESPIQNVIEPVKETVDPSMNLFDNDPVENGFTTEPTGTTAENNPSTLLESLQENFEKTQQLTINNAKEYFNLFTQNTVNINQQLLESMHTRIENVFNLHMQRLDTYQKWISEITEKKG